MPIKIPDMLPARAVLESENIFVITYDRAFHQDIRPLNLLILNLMPTKIVTETQLLRKLSNTSLQIEVELLRMVSHRSKNTAEDHLSSFYTYFENVKSKKYDGMIITGAPVELLNFEDVGYWDELKEIMEWTKKNVFSTFHICWGAQAALYYHYGVRKNDLSKKLSGVFEHFVTDENIPLFRGFDDRFYVPHSRYTELSESDILNVPELNIISKSETAGIFTVISRDNRQIYITGHPEYDADTLALEYSRDVDKNLDVDIPKNYFPGNDVKRPPIVNWRSHAQLLYTNWLNYYVYQTTPYDLEKL